MSVCARVRVRVRVRARVRVRVRVRVCVCVCVCVLKQGYVLLAGDCCVYVCLSGARLCFAW